MADIEILNDSTLQTIEGFGACFNELGWTSLSKLSESNRRMIFKELFAPDIGASFNICRMPVGANDFAREWYSYDETEGDFEMKNFSISNDLETLVPFIKEALKQRTDLKLWASPWSPPSWMKWNKHYACELSEGTDPGFMNNLTPEKRGKEGTNMFIQDSLHFKAYSLYFSKFIESYKSQGITLSMIMPQNEFNSCQIFPSCTWTSAGLTTFVGKYLGSAMNKQNVEIMFGTMERPAEALVDTILNDSLAGKYIRGVGFQWAGKQAIGGIHKRYPALRLYQSEQECGDGKNDWKYCNYAWSLMKHYFNNGAGAYMYWNISLSKGGFSRWGWQQNSLVTVDTVNKTFQYNHEYYLMKHLSHYVKPGAKFIKTVGKYNNLLAFRNPDESIVLVTQNPLDQDYPVRIKLGNRLISANLKGNSFNTILLKKGF
jgi:glucosylceramidase